MNDPRVVPIPAEAVARYRAAGLWKKRTLAQEFRAIAGASPDTLAVASDEGRMTYGDLDAASDRIAAGLAALGLAPGGTVLFQVSNRLAVIPTWYGVLKAGLVPVCTLAPHRGHEIGHIGRAVNAVAHIVEAETPRFDLVAFALGQGFGQVLAVGRDPRVPTVTDLGADVADPRAVVDRIQAGLDLDGVAVFQLSGGTTGVPKLIPRFHEEYWYNALAYAERLGWDGTSRIAHLIPIIHNAGIVCGLHAAHAVGATLVLGTPDLVGSAPLMEREGTTDLIVGHGHFLPAETGLAALKPKRIILSGAKPPKRLFDAMEGLGAWVGQLFGMAEGFFAVSALAAPEDARRTTVGTALSAHDELRILEPGAERELPDGEIGELCCRGPYTLAGYFDAAEHNRQAFTSDGFYRTGDLAKVVRMGDDRHLSIEGRIKDLINRGGEKINAEEVEVLLEKHPAILAAAVVAMPDPRLGEKPCAFLIAKEGPLAMSDVQAHLEALGVAKFKWPERLEWRSELPRSNVNKVDKKALRAELASETGQASTAPQSGTR